MPLEYTLDCQDELLIAVAFHTYTREWVTAEPPNAARAWHLCCAIYECHGIPLPEADLSMI